MTIANLTIIILCDRSDQIFLRSLNSAKVAENILLLDNQSGNNWPAIRKKLKLAPGQLRVITLADKIKDFAKVRNQTIKLASSEWLLFLDSDECLRSQDYERLATAINNPAVTAYRLKRRDYYQGQALRFGETGQSQPLRLVRRTAVQWQRPIHEVAIVPGQVLRLPVVIEHYSHTDVEDFFHTVSLYAQLEAVYRSQFKKASKFALMLQLLCYPPGKFLFNYLLCLGFLDGWAGLVYATLMSHHSLLVRLFTYEKIYQQH